MKLKLMLGVAAVLIAMPQTRNYILSKVSTAARLLNSLLEETKETVKEAKESVKA
jgi:hypothetical protein